MRVSGISAMIMKMFVVAIALLTVLSAVFGQPTPSISETETFVAVGAVEVHREGMTRFGFGMIMRDKNNQKGLEVLNITLDKDKKVNAIDYRLQIYESSPVDYRIRGWTNDPNMHCSVEEIEGMKTLNPFFDWVKYATYAGNKEIDYMKVDLWVAEFGGTILELGLDPNDSSRPLLYSRETVGENIAFKFELFNTTLTATDESYFAIPSTCPPPPKHYDNGQNVYGGGNL